ncbi:hypothetical protein FD12_GL000033 [Lentilactobacillus rapi DSM 19907 = JCM 15042]|uniref:Membrane protein 6-pyruvoyl-tetrahydropterin synthase-related domain-containing protein n=1 Tax=Lentilactobacillus rapi DSM 19907 = JCM 15042 TaxID=1423795 RepID=A0ABR5PG36_9LACO|nr:hypothetical protein [Lentilactobacillus rapi]KRL18325.1 hypothetical protein FD12_GL000033 [Lentilactobacillus rapi DSM 19907 = JCM 15042]
MADEGHSQNTKSLNARLGSFIKRYWLTAIAFLVFSVVNVILLFRYNWLFGGQDLQFHLQRIDEMYNNLIRGNLNPYIATFNLNQLGSAVMSLYPKLPLYLFAAIRLVIGNPITSFYIGTILTTFLCLWISYAAYHSVRPTDTVGAYVFAIAYALSGLNVTYNFLMVDIGISFTIIVLPLVFAGYYHWITAGRYKMLTIGMTIICLSHVLNILITLLALVIFLIIDIRKVTRQKLVSLAKAVGITALLSSSFWIPALHFGTSLEMTKPYTFQLNGISLLKYTTAALSNSIAYGYTIVALIGFVLAIIMYRHLTRFSKEIFWVGIGFVILSSSLFPWHLFQNTSIVLLQFPWRFLILPQLGFTYLFSVLGSELLAKVPQRAYKLGIVGVFTLLVLGLSLNSQSGRVNFELKSPEIKADLYPNSNQIPFVQGMVWYRVTNLSQYKHLMTYIDTGDYLPKMSDDTFHTLSMQRAIQDNNPAVNIPVEAKSQPAGKQMTVEVGTPTKSLALPFVIYDQHYTVKVDGKKYPLKSNRDHVLTVNNLAVGKHTIQVHYHNGLMTAMISLLTIVGLVAILWPKEWVKTKDQTN